MANDLTTAVGGSAPVIPDRATSLAEQFANEIEYRNGVPLLPALPDYHERKLLKQAVYDLSQSLKPAEYSQAGIQNASKLIAAFLMGYESIRRQVSGVNAEPNASQKIVATYLTSLKAFPLFILDAAFKEIVGGTGLAKAKDCKAGFVPNVAQVFQVCDAMIAPYQVEMAKIKKVLAVDKTLPPMVSGEKSAELKARLDDLVSTMKAPLEAERLKAQTEREERANEERSLWIIREYADSGLEPYCDAQGNLVSLALLKRMGAEIVTEDGKVALRLPNGDIHGSVRTPTVPLSASRHGDRRD